MPSESVLRALSAFGLTVEEARPAEPSPPPGPPDARIGDLADRLDAALLSNGIALLTGPSGCGKTTLLRALADRLRSRSRVAVFAPEPRALARRSGAVVDQFRLPPDGPHGSLRLLAAAGLAEARLVARPVNQLSDGQRFRLGVALGMHAARRSVLRDRAPTLLIDEFGSSLDRTTARAVAATLRRWLRAERASLRAVRVAVATAHDDIAEALRPDILVHFDARGRAEVLSR